MLTQAGGPKAPNTKSLFCQTKGYCSSVGIRRIHVYLGVLQRTFRAGARKKSEYIVQLLYILSPCVNLIHDLDALHV